MRNASTRTEDFSWCHPSSFQARHSVSTSSTDSQIVICALAKKNQIAQHTQATRMTNIDHCTRTKIGSELTSTGVRGLSQHKVQAQRHHDQHPRNGAHQPRSYRPSFRCRLLYTSRSRSPRPRRKRRGVVPPAVGNPQRFWRGVGEFDGPSVLPPRCRQVKVGEGGEPSSDQERVLESVVLLLMSRVDYGVPLEMHQELCLLCSIIYTARIIDSSHQGVSLPKACRMVTCLPISSRLKREGGSILAVTDNTSHSDTRCSVQVARCNRRQRQRHSQTTWKCSAMCHRTLTTRPVFTSQTG